MSKRKRKTRSAVASFIRNVKAEIGNLELNAQELPLLYPVTSNKPLKFVPRYPEFTDEQLELINSGRSFLAKALNSPYYQLFKKSANPHILVEQPGKYANEFTKSLIKQRPLAFPDELKKKLKLIKKNTH